MRTSTSPPQDGTRVSLGRMAMPSPGMLTSVGRLVAMNRPLDGRMKPTGALQGVFASLTTTRCGTSTLSWYSMPFAVSTPAPPAPFC